MKLRGRNQTSWILFALLLIGVATVPVPGSAGAVTGLSLSAVPTQVAVGTPFNVSIVLSPAEAVGGWQLTLAFNASLVRAQQVIGGSLWTRFFDNGTINATEGKITGIQSWTTGPFPSSPEILCNVTFVAKSPGVCMLRAFSVEVANASFVLIPVIVHNTSVTILGNGTSGGGEPGGGGGTVVPVVDPGGPYTGRVNGSVQFNGSRSFAPEGNIVAYEWQFFSGDGWHSLGPRPTWVYHAAGAYTVALRVLDDQGNTGVGTTTVLIEAEGANSPPSSPVLSGPDAGRVNGSSTFTVVSTDPEHDAVRYRLDWGDETAGVTMWLASGVPVNVTHTWHTYGVFLVVVWAQDAMNDTSAPYSMHVAIGVKSVPGLGYLIDSTGGGAYDRFSRNLTGASGPVQLRPDGSFLVDVDGDGVWDHVYMPTSGSIDVYSTGSGSGGDPWQGWLLVGGLLTAAVVAVVLLMVRRRNQ